MPALLKRLFLVFFGLSAGGVIAAGVFAFLAIIGVFPRLIGKTGTKSHILLYETVIILGGSAGNAADIFGYRRYAGGNGSSGFSALPVLHGGLLHGGMASAVLTVFGLAVGVFVGCLIMSLAETLKTLPVISRRIRLTVGLQWLVLGIALGKCLGALLYFSRGMGL